MEQVINHSVQYQPRLKFGGFFAPYHHIDGNPTLQIRRDLDLVKRLDDLGFDEAWFGEHHSAGFEIIASPELMVAAAAQRTHRIRLGTGVNSVPFHNPLILADRLNQLDHMTMGRVMAGFGPGQLPSDVHMLGMENSWMRDRMNEAVEVIVALLRGETVTRKTDWFDLRDARLQLGSYTPEGIEMTVTSVFTPTGATLAGQQGIGILSVAAADRKAQTKLVDNWQAHERAATQSGRTSRREKWRVLGILHLADSREQARKDVEWGIRRYQRMHEDLYGGLFDWSSDAEAVDHWIEKGLGSWGSPIIGTPEDAIEAIEHLLQMTGGFGTFLVNSHHAAPWPATQHSWDLFAEYVMPHFQGVNRAREASATWVRQNNDALISSRMQSIAQANEKFQRAAGEAHEVRSAS